MPAKRGEGLRALRRHAYREAILEAAEAVFADYGFEGARMQQVAEQAGISVGSLYSVFASKAELFSDVLTHRLPELLALAMESARDAADPRESLVRGMDVYIGYLLEHPSWLRIHLREHPWGLGPTRATNEQLSAWREGLDLQARVLDEAMRAGQVVSGDPVLMARSIAAMQQVYLAAWVEGGMREDPEHVKDALRGVFFSCFCTERELH